MDEDNEIIVTTHARHRMVERLGIPKSAVQKVALRAYEEGITHKDTKGNLNTWVNGLYLAHKTANNIRLFRDKAYIFVGRKLITVLRIPQSLMKAVQKLGNK